MDLHEFYRNYDEGSRLKQSRAKMLEFNTTIRLIEEYYNPGGSILELGAGHGAYADHWSGQIKNYVASDLVKENVEFMKRRFASQPTIQPLELNAMDLSSLGENQFETVLCLGPYYHLQTKDERQRCLKECVRVMKPGGLIAIAYINKFFAHALYLKYGKYFSDKEYENFTRNEYSALGEIDDFMGLSYFTKPSEVESEVKECDITAIGNFGVDGPYGLISSSLDEMSEPEFHAFSEFHFAHCHEPSTLGMSSHGLLIGTIGR